jgi:predicted nicotinamide N-methyase
LQIYGHALGSLARRRPLLIWVVARMSRKKPDIIAEALATPPCPPADCALRSLDVGSGAPLMLRVPAANHIRTLHIRAAHKVAAVAAGDYNAALQEEYSRLQESEPYYWDQLWPGGIALARKLCAEPELVRGRSVLEFGAGIGLLSCAAARSGAAAVLATDIVPEALAFAAQSARDNSLQLTTCEWGWEDDPPAVVSQAAPFDAVLLPDVMYDDAAVERLGVLAPRLVAPDGLLMWADGTDRPYGESHSERLRELVLAAVGGAFRVESVHELRAGASRDDGGSAPDRPVRLVVMARGGAVQPVPRAMSLQHGDAGNSSGDVARIS